MRIDFASITVQFLAIVGITLAGELLLLWVCLNRVPESVTAQRQLDRTPQWPAVRCTNAQL
jgi:hypothetical protein